MSMKSKQEVRKRLKEVELELKNTKHDNYTKVLISQYSNSLRWVLNMKEKKIDYI